MLQLLLSDVQPDTISYSSVITACERSSLWQLAIQFLRESWTCRTPDVVAFTGTMAACEKAGRWQLALLLLSKMPEDEILPDVVSFGSAICACAPWFWSTGMFNVSSFWILDKTERRSWNPAIKSDRTEPTTHTLFGTVSALSLVWVFKVDSVIRASQGWNTETPLRRKPVKVSWHWSYWLRWAVSTCNQIWSLLQLLSLPVRGAVSWLPVKGPENKDGNDGDVAIWNDMSWVLTILCQERLCWCI